MFPPARRELSSRETNALKGGEGQNCPLPPFQLPPALRNSHLDRFIAISSGAIPSSHQNRVRSGAHSQVGIELASAPLSEPRNGVDVNLPSSDRVADAAVASRLTGEVTEAPSAGALIFTATCCTSMVNV